MNSNYIQKDNNFSNDFEMNLNGVNAYMHKEVRLGFIKKVYGILSAQLFVTFLFCLLSMTSKSFNAFQFTHMGIFWFCLILVIVLPIVIVCFEGQMRKTPNNYIILFVFTFAESYLVSIVASIYSPQIVLMAAFMTCAICISLTVYAVTTKEDFTTQGGLLFVLGCGLLMFGIFTLFTNNKLIHIIYCVCGIVLFGMYLLYDTQLILGTKQNLIEIDDYILASFMLYTDIISIFLKLMELISLLNGNRN
jgi:FtsH-binding integral membrane protein